MTFNLNDHNYFVYETGDWVLNSEGSEELCICCTEATLWLKSQNIYGSNH